VQKEIWKAKEAIYDEVKDLPAREALKAILQKSYITSKKLHAVK